MADGLDAFLDARARLQLDLQRGQRLADVVVQIARQAPALLLLHLEQPARQGAQALLREFQGMLRAQPLGDVVDEDQARGAAAPAHQVADAFETTSWREWLYRRIAVSIAARKRRVSASNTHIGSGLLSNSMR